MRKRRYEILFPRKYNDGRPVSGELFEQAREELVGRFGGVTMEPQTVRGVWDHQGARYEDELVRYVVDVEDTPENQQFFVGWKLVLLQRFQQIEIYITSYLVDVL